MLQVQALLDEYGKAYHGLKTPRKLNWWRSQGHVELSLTVGPDTLNVTVDPVQAAVILAFRDHACLKENELMKATGLSLEASRHAAHFWVMRGVLSVQQGEGGRVYSRSSSLAQASSGAAALAEEEMAGEMPDQLEAGLALMASFEPFIVGMLTNFHALPVDRIHNMLKVHE